MKTITDAFKAHIQGEVTTVCTCITLVRRDGASFGLTDHDMPVQVGSFNCVPFNSYARTSISSTSDLEVDQMEVTGILNSDAFERTDIGAGLFDFAEVEVLLVNYVEPTMGTMSLRKGWIGEIVMNEDGTFNAEIRGLSQVMTYRVGDPYAPECDADLGDVRCKVGLDPDYWAPLNLYRAGDVVMGHISAASGYVNAAMTNNTFAEQTDGQLAFLATGWVSEGDPDGEWYFASNWNSIKSPPMGPLFAAVTDSFGTNTTQGRGMYQDIDLVASGLNTTDIDGGLCRASFTGWVNVANDGDRAQLKLSAIDTSGAVTTIWDTGLQEYAKLRWITCSTDSTLIPTLTRKIRVEFYGTKNHERAWGAAFGGYTMAFNDPNGTFNSDELSQSVMFQAQNGGETGTTEPAFNVVLGNTYTDGSIVWKCISSYKTVTTVTAVTSNQVFAATIPQVDGYYDGGLIVWETGLNAGRSMEVKTWASSQVNLFQRTFFAITVGDRFVIHPGCDKRRATCIAKFNNLLNFRGFPDVPGQDAYMQTPDSQAG